MVMGASVSQELHPGEALPLARSAQWVEPAAAIGGRLGLSARLFLLTVVFVAFAEILIYVPAVANYRRAWLSDRIAAAQVAALVLDAAPEGHVSDDLARRLLAGVGARSITVRSGDTSRLLALEPVPGEIGETIDLREMGWLASIDGAWRTLLAPAKGLASVVGRGQVSGHGSFDIVEIVFDEASLRTALTAFAIRLALSSLVIAAAAAGLVFVVLQRVIVRPVRRLARNIAEFTADPERADRVIAPSQRSDEIGHAEAALARMEITLSGELRQKRRLAELGLSVSKINHELRNLLTTAQLLGDRLDSATDPVVQRVAPRLVGTLDRAIRFCEATLAYGRAAEQHPQRRVVRLAPILAELSDLAGLSADGKMSVLFRANDDLVVDADPDQLARALTNLVRNAVQALDVGGAQDGGPPTVAVEARRDGPRMVILVSDNGPGLPERARAHLFAPFQGSVRAGGTGLGLAIAAELVGLNGGTLSLDPSPVGARFRVVIPDRAAAGFRVA